MPSFQLRDCFIEAECDFDLRAGAAQALVSDALNVANAAAFGLELEREAASVMDDEHVGHAGNGANRLQDCRFDR